VFIGNLDPAVTIDQLKKQFTQYGIVTSTKIPAGKGCGFVSYQDREGAELAIKSMVGKFLGSQRVRVSWGKAAAKAAAAQSTTTPISGALATPAIAAALGLPADGGAFDYNSYYQQQYANTGTNGTGNGVSAVANTTPQANAPLLQTPSVATSAVPSTTAWGSYDWSSYYNTDGSQAVNPQAATDPNAAAYAAGYNYWNGYGQAVPAAASYNYPYGAYPAYQQPTQSIDDAKASERKLVELLKADSVDQRNRDYIQRRKKEFLTSLAGTSYVPSLASTVSSTPFLNMLK